MTTEAVPLPPQDPAPLLGHASSAFPWLLGESRRMREIFAIMRKAARGNVNVFTCGETGTGKELVARAIHQAGPRGNRPLVTLDCATVPEGLMESHLFGHVKGAFTGAVESRDGVLALADAGTLFIDEISELPSQLQAKLLRLIQSREFTMVGGNRPRKIDVRFITASNRDLSGAAGDRSFREDLYYRIAVIRVALPPLRERREDIPLLTAYFLRRFTAKYERPDFSVTPAVMELLVSYDWPGNVRQLENAIEQAVVLADGDVLDLRDFENFFNLKAPSGSATLPAVGLNLRELEHWYVSETLRKIGGNRTRAARLLGISVRGLQYKLQRYERQAPANQHRPTNGPTAAQSGVRDETAPHSYRLEQPA